MNLKIVSDSSSNVFSMEGANYTTVPMKVVFGAKEYIDTPALDVQGMVADLRTHKGKSGSSCPNVQEYVDAFEGADAVFGLTITKYLSGSYNAAQQAAQTYVEENPGAKVCIIDSLSAGPAQFMLADKIKELAQAGLDFEAIREKTLEYQNHLHTLFCLESMMNLARNGRVSPAVAKIAGVLGIRAVGDVKGGQITAVHKPRGEKKAIQVLVDMVKERGFQDGNRIRIAHCFGQPQAENFKAAVLAQFPKAQVVIEPTAALCSFYAEAGGLMIGFEGSYNEKNNNKDF